MKRARAGRLSASAVRLNEGEQGFWPSYADIMSSIAIVLFFFMLLAYIQNLITGNQLLDAQDQLVSKQLELETTISKVQQAEAELNALELNLAGVRADLEKEKETISAQADEIAWQMGYIQQQSDTMNQQAEMLAQQAGMLTQQADTLAKQEQMIAVTTRDLEQIRGEMQNIALLRLSILNEVKDKIQQVLGSDAQVDVNENGNIMLGENLFFSFGSSRLTADGEKLLDELSKAFAMFLQDPHSAQYVDSIVIAGHTDNIGSAAYNRELSTQRANEVLNYLLEEDSPANLVQYADKFSAAGYGLNRPIDTNETEEGRAHNRRIEISIILRDETILDIVNNYLESTQPAVTVQP